MLIEHIKPPEKSWQYDRTNTIGASEIMLCARYLWALKNSVAEDEDFERNWGFAARGNAVEDWVVERLRAAGVDIEFAGNEQQTLLDGFISCSPDGKIGKTAIEIKSFDPRVREIPKPQHRTQIEIAIEMLEADDGVLVYVNASDYSDIREFPVERNPAVIPMAKERARTIFRAKTMDELPREGWIAGGDECGRCPFRRSCIREAPTGVGIPENVEHEVAELHRQARAAADAEKAAKADGRAFKEKISKILRQHGARRAPGLARITVSTRSSLDTSAMVADGIDLSKYQKAGKPSESVTLE